MVEIRQIESKETNDKVTFKVTTILKIVFYIVGVISIIVAWKWYNYDLEIYSDDPFKFFEKTYVGGDAYNYIISSTRSTALMIKSLIWMVFGCSSLIIGLLLSNKSELCK